MYISRDYNVAIFLSIYAAFSLFYLKQCVLYYIFFKIRDLSLSLYVDREGDNRNTELHNKTEMKTIKKNVSHINLLSSAVPAYCDKAKPFAVLVTGN